MRLYSALVAVAERAVALELGCGRVRMSLVAIATGPHLKSFPD